MQRRSNVRLTSQSNQASSFADKREALVAALDDLKAENVVIINLEGKASFADAMIIATGNSSRHIASLADSVTQTLARLGEHPLGVEGRKSSGDWVCVDAGNIVIHIFTHAGREVYRLEKLWSFPSLA